MSLKERVDNIIAYYNNYGANDIDDCVNRLDTLLKNEKSVTGYRIGKDTDVFDVRKIGSNFSPTFSNRELCEGLKPQAPNHSHTELSGSCVLDSPGVDIYYVSVAWVDGDGLHLCGGPVYSC